MASLRTRTRADGTMAYQVLYRRGGRSASQQSMTFETDAAALEFIGNIDSYGIETALKILSAATTAKTSITVAEMVAQHIDSLSGVEDGTIKEYRTALSTWIAPHPISRLPIEAVTRDDVADWVRWIEKAPSRTGKPLSAKSIKNRHTVLSGAFATAERRGLRAGNPAEGVRLPTGVRTEMVFLTHEEVDLLVGCTEEQFQPFVQFLVGTGMRLGEASALLARSVDLTAKTPVATVTQAWKYTGGKPRLGGPKSKAGRRSVSLAPETVEAIQALAAKRNPADFLFQSRVGTPIMRTWIYKAIWIPACTKAAKQGLKKRPRIHDLRHTHASWLIAAGVPLNVIQYRLGHESIQTTVDRYGHLADNALAVAADATSKALRGVV